jgi:glycosyltransferase involved in cell wall biosynthesis
MPVAATGAVTALPSAGPLFPHVGIVGLVPDAWTAPWQPRHQVMRRLATFFQVTWVSPAPEWRHALAPREAGDPYPVPGLAVYRPPRWLPQVYRPAAAGRLLLRARLRQVRRGLARRGATRTVLYLWRPGFADALDTPHDLSVYHVDDDYAFDPDHVGLPPREREVLERVDRVVIHSPGLMDLKGGVHPHTAHVPNGVDFHAFAAAHPEPADLAAIPRPRAGYAGWLKPQLDWALLDAVAARHPGVSFVLVGAAKHTDRLEADPAWRSLVARPNVHRLGAKPPEALAAYPGHFDACLMPYRLDRYTDCIYPLKLHEYLATGRPVIGTPIRSLRDFAGVVALAAGPEAWDAALREALGPGAMAPDAVAARRRVARAHDWWTLAGRIATLIAEPLGLATPPIATRAAAEAGLPSGHSAPLEVAP